MYINRRMNVESVKKTALFYCEYTPRVVYPMQHGFCRVFSKEMPSLLLDLAAKLRKLFKKHLNVL